MDRRQAQTAADDERMSSCASVKRGKRVANSLNSRRSEGRALADVEIHKPFLLIPVLLHGFPYLMIVLHSAVGQRIHGPVRYVLAVVEAEGSEMKAVVCQSNDAVICGKTQKDQSL